MVSRLKSDIEEGFNVKTVFILSGNAEEESYTIQEQIHSLFPEIEMISGPLGSAVGVHTGSGTIALNWFRE